MSAKFTKGPWRVGGGTGFINQVQIDPSIGCAYGAGEEVAANAALIAASPELFDAVDMLVKSFTAAGIAADCDSNDPAEVLMCKAMRAWLKAGAI